MINRRSWFKKSAAAIVSVPLAGRVLADDPAVPADPTKVMGLPPREVGVRSEFEKLQRLVYAREVSSASATPLQSLSGIITPSDLHFERHHGGIPTIDPDRYELLVHGLVDRPLKFSLADLKRFPAESRICFIECSGNGRRAVLGDGPVAEQVTAGQVDGLLSTSEWTGVRLSTLFNEVGLRKKAKWFLAEGQDSAVMTRTVPVEKGLDDAMIVYAQNGEPMRPGQGYPVRLLLPGWEGNAQVKWLRRIDVSDTPFFTREETSKYTDAKTDGRIEMFSFVMAPKSLITSPSFPTVLQGKGWVEVRGLAWTGHGKIATVEVSTDGGNRWRQAAIQAPVLSKSTVRFRAPWQWDGKPALFMSRATDEFGNTQHMPNVFPDDRGPATSYHHNAVRAWKVDADGRVTFGQNQLA